MPQPHVPSWKKRRKTSGEDREGTPFTGREPPSNTPPLASQGLRNVEALNFLSVSVAIDESCGTGTAAFVSAE